MKIKVKTLKGETIEFDVNPSDTVESLKDQIEKRLNNPKSWQKLIYSGKILADNNTIESYNVKEGEFFVLFVKQPKAEPEKKEEPKPAPQPTPSTPAQPETPSTPATTQAPSSAPATQTPASTQPATVQDQGIAQGEEFETMVQNIVAMGFPRDKVVRALNASFRNPERAVQYLVSGNIPEFDEDSMEGSEDLSIPPDVNILPTGGAQGQQGREPNPFDFLRNHPQFTMLRAMVQQNPQLLQPVLQQLAAANPQILQLIEQHQDEFIRLLQEPVNEAELQQGLAGMGAGGLGSPGMQYVQVTHAEKEAIDRLCNMGFERRKVIEAFFLCDKDEELAANYLLEHQDDDDL